MSSGRDVPDSTCVLSKLSCIRIRKPRKPEDRAFDSDTRLKPPCQCSQGFAGNRSCALATLRKLPGYTKWIHMPHGPICRKCCESEDGTSCLQGLAQPTRRSTFGYTSSRIDASDAAQCSCGFLSKSIGAPIHPCDRGEYDENVAPVRAALGEESFAAAWASGRAMTLERAIEDSMGNQASE